MRLFGLTVLAICVGVARAAAAAVPDAKPAGASAALAADFPLTGNVTFAELLATIVDACPEVAGFYDSAAKGNFTSFLSVGILALGHSFDLLEGAVLALASSDAAFAGAFAAGSFFFVADFVCSAFFRALLFFVADFVCSAFSRGAYDKIPLD